MHTDKKWLDSLLSMFNQAIDNCKARHDKSTIKQIKQFVEEKKAEVEAEENEQL